VVQTGSTDSGAPLVCSRSKRSPASIQRAHQLDVGVEVVFTAPGPLAPVRVDIAAERPLGLQHRDLGRVIRGLDPAVQARVAAGSRDREQRTHRRLGPVLGFVSAAAK